MKIELWGRGGEISVFSLSAKQFEHWSNLKNADGNLFHRVILGDCNDPSGVDEKSRVVPLVELRLLASAEGANLDDAALRVISDSGEVLLEDHIPDIIEGAKDDNDGDNDMAVELSDFYFDWSGEKFGMLIEHRQKGLFETFELSGACPLNINLFQFEYIDIEGVPIIKNLLYDGKRLEPDGAISTESIQFISTLCALDE